MTNPPTYNSRILVDVAMGRKPADLVILKGSWVSVSQVKSSLTRILPFQARESPTSVQMQPTQWVQIHR
jgi:hypothetical protein